MLTSLKSTLSAVTSTLQAISELPGTLKEAIVFTRENSEVKRELEAANKQLDKGLRLHLEWMNLCLGRNEELDIERFVNSEQWDWAKERITALTSEANELARALESERRDCQKKLDLQRDAVKAIEKEHDTADAQIKATRSVLEYFSSWLSNSPPIESESLPALAERVKRVIEHHVVTKRDEIYELKQDREWSREQLARYEAAETTINHLKSALNRDKTGLALALCNIREHVNGCKWIPDGENASYSYDEMSEETIRKECGYIIASVDQIAEKALLESGALATSAVRDELTEQFETMKTKLARYEAAEKWHQVTAGEGELPPEGVEIIYKLSPSGPLLVGDPYALHKTFEWRYASSEDVP